MKRLITVIVLITIVFNIVSTDISYADDYSMYRHGLIAFVAVLASYGITFANYQREKIIALYDDFICAITPSELIDYYQQAKIANKSSLTDTTFSPESLGIALNRWIKSIFDVGYNSISIPNGDISIIGNIDGGSVLYTLVPGLSAGKVIHISGLGMSATLTIVKSYTEPGMTYKYDVAYNLAGLTGTFLCYNYNGGSYTEFGINSTRNPGYITSFVYNSGNKLFENKVLPSDISSVVNPTISTSDIDYYAGGVAVDLPIDVYPDDEPKVPFLPAPINWGSDKVTTGLNGDRVYNGDIDDFLDDAVSDSDYVNDIVDSVSGSIAGGVSRPLPVVDSVAGTITWPVAIPTPVPVNPSIPIPTPVARPVEEGVGSIDASLTGLLEWLGKWFAAPTATIDFSPLIGINIQDKFPFSLPFDLAGIFTSLQASPEAPEWVLKWGTSTTGNINIPINFEQFEPWARIVRWGVLIIFIIGLIVVTRNMIGG